MKRFVLALTFLVGVLVGHTGLLLGAPSPQEILTLTTPVSGLSTTTWQIADIYMSNEAPSLKATLKSNTGERFVYRSVPSDTVTEAQIRAGLKYVNQGKFMTLEAKSLHKWLLDRISSEGIKVGTVSGTPQRP
ncbi:MAG: hypothetical protein A3H96_11305 [Acidobacteria bacterium RIFCSPLOWO2_02_FULL_67_36]|nr:MAG: hypothetical protein A3H96_11305 [Acidobacteria bacterium RIFCSPLOWO2_02_FULL_67_36]OFW40509.1 MAG: hypothetical protein A3F70_00910 [Acidobacteria bacterium RIFCSPLOWO2_12_FULL_67_14]